MRENIKVSESQISYNGRRELTIVKTEESTLWW